MDMHSPIVPTVWTHPRSSLHLTATVLVLAVTLLSAVLSACGASPAAQRQVTTGQATQAADRYSLSYVAIGASDAFGVGTEDPDRQSWPTQLAARLGTHVHLINLGIPGETAGQALLDELPVALDAKPDVVTIWLGVNDFADGVPLATFRQQIGSLFSALRQGTHARIVAGNLPDLSLLPRFFGYGGGTLQADVSRWNAAIAELCAQNGVTLVDIFGGWSELAQHPEYVSSDGLHPSTLGAQRLADLFAAALRQVPVR
jgi:acyl-CoA thioesterase I